MKKKRKDLRAEKEGEMSLAVRGIRGVGREEEKEGFACRKGRLDELGGLLFGVVASDADADAADGVAEVLRQLSEVESRVWSVGQLGEVAE